MKYLLVLFLVALAASEVIELTSPEELKAAIEDPDNTWFIKFYGPNCGFCKNMAPAWEKLAEMVETEGLDLKVAQYNVHAEGMVDDYAKHYLPGPLPGLHLFVPGDDKFFEFYGARFDTDPDHYLSFALYGYEDQRAQATPKNPRHFYEEKTDIVNIMNETDWNQRIRNGESILVMGYGPKCGWCKGFMPKWHEAATLAKERGLDFIVARINGFDIMSLIDRMNMRPWPSVVFVKGGYYWRWNTDQVREVQDVEEILSWVVDKKYEEVEDDHKGIDSKYEEFLKLEAAKAKSKARKEKKEKSAEL